MEEFHKRTDTAEGGDTWKRIEEALSDADILDYSEVIVEDGKEITLNIDVDLGGGFEGGFASTALSAVLPHNTLFRFAVHREDFIDEIGKFFGMQDVKVGYVDFDKKMIIKTNDEEKVKSLFSSDEIRSTLLDLSNFSLGIHSHNVSHSRESFLELVIDDAVTDITLIKKLHHCFLLVLKFIEDQLPVSDLRIES